MASVLWLLLGLSPNLQADLSDAPLYRAHFIWSNARFLAWHTGSDWHYLEAQCYQESLFEPAAVSAAGAIGLCQFLPSTFQEVMSRMGWDHVSPYSPKASIIAAGAYMEWLLRKWTAERSQLERLRFGWASYNCGFGCVLKAQSKANGSIFSALVWPHLPQETQTYTRKIEYYHREFSEE